MKYVVSTLIALSVLTGAAAYVYAMDAKDFFAEKERFSGGAIGGG
jgi:hypothetical protein